MAHSTHDRDAHHHARSSSSHSVRSHRSLPHLSVHPQPGAPPMPNRPPLSRQSSSPMGPRPPGTASPLSGPPPAASSPSSSSSPATLQPPPSASRARSHSPAASHTERGSGGRRPSTAQEASSSRPTARHEPSSSRRPATSSPATPSASSVPAATPLSEAALKAYSARYLSSSHPTSSRKSSGNASDSGASVLDMKRLLSKPAPSSTRSAPSEASEPPSVPRAGPSRGRYTSAAEPKTASSSTASAQRSTHRSASYTASASHSRAAPTLKPQDPSPSPRRSSFSARKSVPSDKDRDRDRDHRPAALKHRSSHSTMRPSQATPTAGSFPTSVHSPRRATTAPEPASRSPRPPTERNESPLPRSVTPAGAIMLAYKEQEKRRSQLAMLAGEQTPEATTTRPAQSPNPASSRDSNGSAAGVYYTVFGNTSGKVVAVGGPEDDAWRLNMDAYYGWDAPSHKSASVHAGSGSGSSGVRRSLSRKVSARWRRANVRGESSPSTSGTGTEDRRAEAPRQSLQERRSASLPKERRKSLRLSIDGYVDMAAVASPLPSARNGAPSAGTPKAKLRKQRDKESREDEHSPGGKLWKLMKRISTGGLRDKYSSASPEVSPPPVPALPRDLPAHSRTTTQTSPSSDSQGSSPNPLTRYLSPRPSMTALRSTPRTPVHPRSSSGPAPTTSSGRKSTRTTSTTGPRPSTTTRSSSPISSSDVASSSRFFKSNVSSRSSSSSYGEEIQSTTHGTAAIGKYIIPPGQLEELHKLDLSFMKNPDPAKRSPTAARSRQADDSPPPISAVDAHPAPLAPPRSARRAFRSESPEIPSFSTDGPVNDFSAAARTKRARHVTSSFGARPATSPVTGSFPASELGALSPPPPRPAKSPRRPLSAAVAPTTPLIPPLAPLPTITMDLEAVAASRERHDEDNEDDRQSRAVRTASNASTMKDGRRSRSRSQAPAPSPVTFRELGTSPARLRSEQEKARMWDALLERSDRAGGTLRVGGDDELPSDSLRLSTFSDF
ncbi:hypothetical protein PUNSTDRAFT_119958 [Punctularia strigosozonata HHB-11173 SS5]|uniref:uncharacterized protein n=1 Tax=Punctularia strigosozonata (strain HHB-11173) TaxID=741275 RepID=UPI0004417272|nr:uncharacterized protein PUNSTDRAFT_119958 [Punctularia strigosozonata HHB-11173 SS5]EIN09481.1 hypothetical protein PUNSTDRAFT_119958 [Punctularia strigosozonata HHB-11173 SS5]